MARHTRFKLAVIRTMRCDFCNEGNVNGLQECQDCNMHFCRQCIDNGMMNNDEKHRMQQDVIDNLDWTKPSKAQRASHRRATTANSPAFPSRQKRRQARAEGHARPRGDHHTGNHHEPAPLLQGPQDPRVQQHVGAFSGGDVNAPAHNHDHAGHSHFQYASAPPTYHPGYPSGYAPSPPNLAMYGVPPSGQDQRGQQPSQGGGLAMPLGPMFGHHYSVLPGLAPRSDPRLHTPPGQQYHPSGYQAPNNVGGYYGEQPLGYTPAPTPQSFAGPVFNQQILQPPAVYNDRGYIPRGNMPTGQPGLGPGQASGHAYGQASGQPYGPGAFPFGPPPQEQQRRPFGYEGERTQGEQVPHPAEHGRARAREQPFHAHAEQSVDPLATQRQQQQQAWEQEQAREAWERQQARQEWERQRARQATEHTWERSQQQQQQQQQQQPVQQNAQPMAQQQQPQARGQYEPRPAPRPAPQPAVQQASQAAPRAQQQDEQRLRRRGEQQLQQPAVRPTPGGGVVNRPPPVTVPSFARPPVITLPVTAPRNAAPSLQESQPTPLAPAPRQSAPASDTTSQVHSAQLGETYNNPSVIGHAQRPFGIPALARDLYTGRPNHYDETSARWARAKSEQRVKQPREYASDDYEDTGANETEDDADATVSDPDRPPGPPSDCQPSPTPPPPPPPTSSRGVKRALSRESSAVDSTLSAELDEPAPAGAAVPGTEELRRELREDASIVRVRREGGERAALGMAAAANTLQGGGRGLHGVADAQVVANDREIQRRQDAVDQHLCHEGERRGPQPVTKRGRGGGGGRGRGG